MPLGGCQRGGVQGYIKRGPGPEWIMYVNDNSRHPPLCPPLSAPTPVAGCHWYFRRWQQSYVGTPVPVGTPRWAASRCDTIRSKWKETSWLCSSWDVILPRCIAPTGPWHSSPPTWLVISTFYGNGFHLQNEVRVPSFNIENARRAGKTLSLANGQDTPVTSRRNEYYSHV